ncbi:Pkinase-domain-containing protein [Testicularia cyperi]|uniref:Pkinase-domain-containing protein n=1 Tax=Testicularia cyperi TaxID=1882483 RepID=A0A317XKW7_9BASI|nr:Pkinase-domain-containing protein [Testicularia cyperi]
MPIDFGQAHPTINAPASSAPVDIPVVSSSISSSPSKNPPSSSLAASPQPQVHFSPDLDRKTSPLADTANTTAHRRRHSSSSATSKDRDDQNTLTLKSIQQQLGLAFHTRTRSRSRSTSSRGPSTPNSHSRASSTTTDPHAIHLDIAPASATSSLTGSPLPSPRDENPISRISELFNRHRNRNEARKDDPLSPIQTSAAAAASAASPSRSRATSNSAQAASTDPSNSLSPPLARQKSSKREQVKMVGSHLHHAFRSWFKETEKDGTPLLPVHLSKKYEVLPQVLGQGSFAVVKAVIERATGEQRALKIIAKKPLKDNSEKMLKEEITILGKVEHPNIIKMWDLYETREGVFIVTDLCKGGELFDRLVQKVHYNELDARHIMKQILEGVAYLHEHDIIHRDLKPENILLRDKTDPSGIVISDFGLSRFIPDEGLLMTACGSPQYVSPEVLLGKGYNAAVDIWSCGVIAYALLGGYTPFYGEDQPSLFRQIIQMQVEFEPQYWSEVSDTAKDFILRCLTSADKRMSAREALAHPWLANLPPLHEESAKGACLKEGALRNLSAMRRLRKAVTAVEAVNHLTRLHHLRQQRGDALPHKQQSLLSIVTHLKSHSQDDVLVTPTNGHGDARMPLKSASEPSADSLATVTSSSVSANASDQAMTDAGIDNDDGQSADRKRGGDSAMALDLTVMMVMLPNGWGRPSSNNSSNSGSNKAAGTAAVADAVQSTMNRGRDPTSSPSRQRDQDDDGEGQSQDGDVLVDGQASPSASSTGQSEATIRPSGQAPPPTATANQPRRPGRSVNRKDNESSKTLTTLLDQYKKAEVPSSARLDPAIKTRQPTKITFANAWRYVPFLVQQGVSIGSAVASHAIYGPPKKSWGIEMSVFTRVLRDVAEYSEFASIEGLQQFFDLGAFLPTPKDGLITPVTFRVKKRNLRGFLAEADAAEDGKREISAEWVVGKQTWRRLQAEWRSGKQKGKERVILYIHGGAYFVMSAATHRPLTISLSKYTECRVFGINYRLAPGTKFPGALHDCVASYFRLTEDLGIPPSNIVLGADSAGGGLALALMYYLRDNDYEMPSGAMLFSPWVDLTMSCDSWDTNSEFDYLPMPRSGDHMNPVSAYLGDNIDKYITHPYASPLFGDMHGLPPLLIQCGDAEVLRDEVTLLAHKASLSGVPVRHELYEDCVHVFQAFLFLDASRKALQSARHFVRTALDKRGKPRQSMGKRAESSLHKEMADGGMQTPKGQAVDTKTGNAKSTTADAGSSAAAKQSGSDASDADKAREDGGSTSGITPSSSVGGVDGGIKEMVSLPHSRTDGSVDDEDEDEGDTTALPADEEDWELDRRASGDNYSSSENKTAGLAAQAAQKVLGVDDKNVTADMNEEVAATKAEDKAQESKGKSQAKASQGESSSTSTSAGGGRESSFPQMTIEEARLRGHAAMEQQLSSNAPALSKFHAPEKPLSPRMRRSGSEKALSGLLQSFEQSKTGGSGLKTNVYTPSTGDK